MAHLVCLSCALSSAATLRNKLRDAALSRSKTKEESRMSDPNFDRDPDRRRYAYRESTFGTGSVWIAAIVAILVIAGITAYGYRNSTTASNQPATTTGQSTPAPVSSPPASAPPASTAPVTPATPADPAAQRP
jgi:hypothetical protein